MRYLTRAFLNFIFPLSSIKGNEAFVLCAKKLGSGLQREPSFCRGIRLEHDPGDTCCHGEYLLMKSADAPTPRHRQQSQQRAGIINVEGDPPPRVGTEAKESQSISTTLRSCVSSDGTRLVMQSPSVDDLRRLHMASLAGQNSSILAVAAFRQGEAAEHELETAGPLLAGAVIEVNVGVGGSSVATRVCLLRHKRLEIEEASEEVEHCLLDEIIAMFLNGGSRISQVLGCFRLIFLFVENRVPLLSL